MIDDVSPSELMQAHVDIQTGTFFSGVKELQSGTRFAFSSRIADHYWNYAYGINCNPRDLPNRIIEIRECALQLDRQATIYITPDTSPSQISDILAAKNTSTETWMTLASQNLQRVAIPNSLRIVSANSDEDIESFIRVFRNAYGSEDPGSAGYSGLPEEYPESIRHACPNREVYVTNFVGWQKNIPVAISSIFCKPPYAGLYSVGTTHQTRRKGYGTIMSFVAIEQAVAMGCKIIFLQTEPDSPVEDLYQKLGFRRRFLGEFIVLN
jgi:hypothetical protein